MLTNEQNDKWSPPVIASIKLVRAENAVRFPDESLKSVVFLGRYLNRAFKAVGTGFLVIHRRATYLITADHVAKKLGDTFAVRLNARDGNARVFLAPPSAAKWWRHPTDHGVDAAVYPWHLSSERSDAVLLPSDRFVTPGNLARTLIGIGDETLTLGLFRGWAGSAKITPIVRSGHIAMMAGERIPTKNYGDALLHLIEAMTTAGLSGSPVYVRETITAPMHQSSPQDPRWLFGLGDFYLLGLVHGFMPIKVAEELIEADQRQRWHSGICMVVPSTQILEILNQPSLVKYEDEIMKKPKRPPNDDAQPIETAIIEEPQQTTLAPNREHRVKIPVPTRDQFNADLAKATRKRKS